MYPTDEQFWGEGQRYWRRVMGIVMRLVFVHIQRTVVELLENFCGK